VVLAESVKMGYFAQHAMDLLDGGSTVFGKLEHPFPHARQVSLRSLAGAFGFSGDEVEKQCRLSRVGATPGFLQLVEFALGFVGLAAEADGCLGAGVYGSATCRGSSPG
jgi:hypothetical protein